MERGPEMRMEDEAALGLAVHWFQQALITAYEDNCLLRPAKNGRTYLKCTSDLESLGREVNGSLIGAGLTTNHLVGNSIDRLNIDIGRRYTRLPKRSGGHSLAPLTIYEGRLGYTGLCLGTLKLGWDPV